jgi:hypothetical protein
MIKLLRKLLQKRKQTKRETRQGPLARTRSVFSAGDREVLRKLLPDGISRQRITDNVSRIRYNEGV